MSHECAYRRAAGEEIRGGIIFIKFQEIFHLVKSYDTIVTRLGEVSGRYWPCTVRALIYEEKLLQLPISCNLTPDWVLQLLSPISILWAALLLNVSGMASGPGVRLDRVIRGYR